MRQFSSSFLICFLSFMLLRIAGFAGIMSIFTFSQPSTSAVFCVQCHALLDMPATLSNTLTCRLCKFEMPFDASVFDSQPAVWSKKFTAKSSAEIAKSLAKEVKAQPKAKKATITQDCPKCANETMLYNTAQLRSADEGQTVFYECPRCGYQYNENQ